MPQVDHTGGNTLSRGQASLLGLGLLVCGAVLLVVALGSIEGPAVFFVVVGAGGVCVGTWLFTIAKTVGERPIRGDSDAKPES